MIIFQRKQIARARALLSRLRLPAPLARLRDDQRGATAIEFAFVAGPFFAMLFGIMQTSIVIFANQALQTMTSMASRQIMTGEIINAGTGIDGFRQAICDRQGAAKMFKCSNLKIQVQSFSSFVGLAATIKNDACFQTPPPTPAPNCWNPGAARSIVLVRVQYEWPFGFNLETLKAKHTLVAISAFRSEPY